MDSFLEKTAPDTQLAKTACDLAEKLGLVSVCGYEYERCQFVAALRGDDGKLSWRNSGGTQDIAFRLSLNDYLASVSPAEDFLHMTDEEVISRI